MRRPRPQFEIVLPQRSVDPRRPVRQQRLAAGAAEADHQADVGQRRVREPGDRRTAQGRQHAVVAGRRARTDRRDGGRDPLRRPRRARRGVSMPGHPDDCVTVHLGYGRTRAGQVGTRRRLQRERDSHLDGALVRRRRRDRADDRRDLLARVHAVSPLDGRPRHDPRGHARRVRPQAPKWSHEGPRGAERAGSPCIPDKA